MATSRTAAQIQAEMDSIAAARAGGLRAITDQNGEKVEFKSDAEMKAAYDFDARQLATLTQPTPVTMIRCNYNQFGDRRRNW